MNKDNEEKYYYFRLTDKHGKSKVALMTYAQVAWFCLFKDCEWELVG